MVTIGFVSPRERRGAERKLLKRQLDDPNYTAVGCWMHIKTRELAAKIIVRLVEQRRTFDVVINQ